MTDTQPAPSKTGSTFWMRCATILALAGTKMSHTSPLSWGPRQGPGIASRFGAIPDVDGDGEWLDAQGFSSASALLRWREPPFDPRLRHRAVGDARDVPIRIDEHRARNARNRVARAGAAIVEEQRIGDAPLLRERGNLACALGFLRDAQDLKTVGMRLSKRLKLGQLGPTRRAPGCEEVHQDGPAAKRARPDCLAGPAARTRARGGAARREAAARRRHAPERR